MLGRRTRIARGVLAAVASSLQLACSALPRTPPHCLPDFPYREGQPTLELMGERIGADRLLWGTDMPFQNRFSTYRQSRDWLEKYCDILSAEDLALIMGGSAQRVLGL